VSAWFGFAEPFRVAEEALTLVAAWEETVGVASVVNDATFPKLVPTEF
jgi:hypothetical protein